MTLCPMFGDDCPYCSLEATYRPYTEIKKENNVFKPVKTGYLRVVLGAFCNNDGNHFVDEMHYCPRRWAVRRGVTKPKVKEIVRRKTAKRKPEKNKVEIKKRRGSKKNTGNPLHRTAKVINR